MKKSVITIVALVGCIGLSAQQSQSSSTSPSKSLTVAEANRLNGNKEPSYQGKMPYSQWVAEQKALHPQSSQTPVAPVVPAQFVLHPQSWDGKPVNAALTQDQLKNMQTQQPVVTKEEEKTVTTVTVPEPVPGSRAYNAGANKSVQPGQDPSSKQSPANNTPVVEKPVIQQGSNGSPDVTPENKPVPAKKQQ